MAVNSHLAFSSNTHARTTLNFLTAAHTRTRIPASVMLLWTSQARKKNITTHTHSHTHILSTDSRTQAIFNQSRLDKSVSQPNLLTKASLSHTHSWMSWVSVVFSCQSYSLFSYLLKCASFDFCFLALKAAKSMKSTTHTHTQNRKKCTLSSPACTGLFPLRVCLCPPLLQLIKLIVQGVLSLSPFKPLWNFKTLFRVQSVKKTVVRWEDKWVWH